MYVECKYTHFYHT